MQTAQTNTRFAIAVKAMPQKLKAILSPADCHTLTLMVSLAKKVMQLNQSYISPIATP